MEDEITPAKLLEVVKSEGLAGKEVIARKRLEITTGQLYIDPEGGFVCVDDGSMKLSLEPGYILEVLSTNGSLNPEIERSYRIIEKPAEKLVEKKEVKEVSIGQLLAELHDDDREKRKRKSEGSKFEYVDYRKPGSIWCEGAKIIGDPMFYRGSFGQEKVEPGDVIRSTQTREEFRIVK